MDESMYYKLIDEYKLDKDDFILKMNDKIYFTYKLNRYELVNLIDKLMYDKSTCGLSDYGEACLYILNDILKRLRYKKLNEINEKSC